MYSFNLTLVIALVIFQCIIYSYCGIKPRSVCPVRTESNARCRKECTSDRDCLNRKRNKKCICDGPCGLSCVKISQKCYEDRSLVTRLRKGKVFLNGNRYRKGQFKVGDVVSYACKDGFKLAGPMNVTCSGIGKWKPWDQGTTACRKQCRDPGHPKDGRRVTLSINEFNVGSKVKFICRPGYVMKGSAQLECLDNLEWSSSLPTCEVAPCPKLVLPENSYILHGEKPSYSFGDRIFLSCNVGFFQMGPSVMYCVSMGWQTPTGTPLQCFPKSCGNPGSIRNGLFEGRLYTFGKEVKYSCNQGYKLRGASVRRCLKNERWSGSRPICERVDCGELPSIENGAYEVYGTKYLDRASVKCSIGYLSSGSTEVVCTASGEWSHKPRCIGVTCDKDFTSVENGKVFGSNVGSVCQNSYNCKLTFTCENGFELESGRRSETAFCQGNGEWSINKPKCQRISCGRPRIPSHGKLVGTSNGFLYDSVIEYKCDDKYEMIGSSTSRCLANRAWGGVPYCQANCGYPGPLVHGVILGTSYRSNDRINFKCNEGFTLIGSSTSECEQETATWSSKIPNCARVYCGEPRSPPQGGVKALHGYYYFESEVKYECNPRYKMIGSDLRKCLANGRWEGTPPRCVADCGDPGEPTNGYRMGDSFIAGAIVEFSCKEGYKIKGPYQITCQQKDAKWSSEIPTCEKRCDYALGMKDGRIADDQIIMSNSLNDYKPRLNNGNLWCGKYEFGEVRVTIKFKSIFKITGVNFNGTDKRRANRFRIAYYSAVMGTRHFQYKDYNLGFREKNIAISSPIYTSHLEIVMNGESGQTVCEGFEVYGCEAPVTCKIPRAPKNGDALGFLYKVGDNAVYSCFHGYKLSSNLGQQCQMNGTWFGTIPDCIKDDKQGECYMDGPKRSLPWLVGLDVAPQDCSKKCKRRRFKFAGVQYAGQCWCGSQIKESLIAPASDCYIPCDRNLSVRCGGPWRNSVYNLVYD